MCPRLLWGGLWPQDLVVTTWFSSQILRDTFAESCIRISQDERHKMKDLLGMGQGHWDHLQVPLLTLLTYSPFTPSPGRLGTLCTREAIGSMAQSSLNQ